MPQTHSKSRQRAEVAFSKAQSQSLARRRVAEESDADVRSRAEKTLRLREARLAKESRERTKATAAVIAKPTRKI